MDFEVEINDEIRKFSKFDEVIQIIKENLAYWNNFNPNFPMHISIRKIYNGTSTLGISVSDEVLTDDIFGRK